MTAGIERVEVLTTSCGHRHHGRRIVVDGTLDISTRDRIWSRVAIDTVGAFGCDANRWVLEGRIDFFFATQADADAFTRNWTP